MNSISSSLYHIGPIRKRVSPKRSNICIIENRFNPDAYYLHRVISSALDWNDWKHKRTFERCSLTAAAVDSTDTRNNTLRARMVCVGRLTLKLQHRPLVSSEYIITFITMRAKTSRWACVARAAVPPSRFCLRDPVIAY